MSENNLKLGDLVYCKGDKKKDPPGFLVKIVKDITITWFWVFWPDMEKTEEHDSRDILSLEDFEQYNEKNEKEYENENNKTKL